MYVSGLVSGRLSGCASVSSTQPIRSSDKRVITNGAGLMEVLDAAEWHFMVQADKLC